MKRLVLIFTCILCTIVATGQDHLMFRHIPIDGKLKVGMKEFKKMGLSGIRIENIGLLMGQLDGEEAMVTLMSTPKTKTLFCVAIMYDGYNTWEEAMVKFEKHNASLAAKYGEPKEFINKWEEPYSIENNPLQGLKEDKGEYTIMYACEQGEIALGIAYDEGKLGILIAYMDKQNYELFENEGGEDFDL